MKKVEMIEGENFPTMEEIQNLSFSGDEFQNKDELMKNMKQFWFSDTGM